MAATDSKRYRDGVQRVRDDAGKITGYRVQIRRTGYPVVTKRFSRLEDARRWRERMSREIELRQTDPEALASRYTLSDAIDGYLAGEFNDLRPSTQRDRKIRCEWWRAQLGDVVLRDLTRSMVRERLLSETRAPATTNNLQSTISAVLSSAQEREWISRNVARDIRRQRGTGKRERVITGDEWKRLLAAAREIASAPEARLLERQLPNYLRLLYATGMRAGEATTLRWRDVDLPGRRVQLRDTKNREDRVVPLDEEAVEALEAQRAFGQDGWPWVFVGRSPRQPANRFNPEFSQAREKAKIGPDERGEPLVMHSLRHSFATELADGGADLFELMAATGHKSIVSAQRYIKTKEEQAVRALAKRRRV